MRIFQQPSRLLLIVLFFLPYGSVYSAAEIVERSCAAEKNLSFPINQDDAPYWHRVKAIINDHCHKIQAVIPPGQSVEQLIQFLRRPDEIAHQAHVPPDSVSLYLNHCLTEQFLAGEQAARQYVAQADIKTLNRIATFFSYIYSLLENLKLIDSEYSTINDCHAHVGNIDSVMFIPETTQRLNPDPRELYTASQETLAASLIIDAIRYNRKLTCDQRMREIHPLLGHPNREVVIIAYLGILSLSFFKISEWRGAIHPLFKELINFALSDKCVSGYLGQISSEEQPFSKDKILGKSPENYTPVHLTALVEGHHLSNFIALWDNLKGYLMKYLSELCFLYEPLIEIQDAPKATGHGLEHWTQFDQLAHFRTINANQRMFDIIDLIHEFSKKIPQYQSCIQHAYPSIYSELLKLVHQKQPSSRAPGSRSDRCSLLRVAATYQDLKDDEPSRFEFLRKFYPLIKEINIKAYQAFKEIYEVPLPSLPKYLGSTGLESTAESLEQAQARQKVAEELIAAEETKKLAPALRLRQLNKKNALKTKSGHPILHRKKYALQNQLNLFATQSQLAYKPQSHKYVMTREY